MQNFFANVWKNLRLAVTLTAVLFLAVSGLQVVAQSDTGRITGTVSDTTGAAIPGATITVTNTGTNATQTVSSDGIGDFTVSALPTGNYHIAVAKTGFATQEQNLRLDVAQVQTENFKLAAGAERRRQNRCRRHGTRNPAGNPQPHLRTLRLHERRDRDRARPLGLGWHRA